MYNFRDVHDDRKWLRDIVLDTADTETDISDEDEYVKQMLGEHVKEQKYRAQYYQSSKNAQYGYYGAGIVSLHDSFYEHQRSIVGNKRQRKMPRKHIVAAKVRKYTLKQQQKQQLQQQKLEARQERLAAIANARERKLAAAALARSQSGETTVTAPATATTNGGLDANLSMTASQSSGDGGAAAGGPDEHLNGNADGDGLEGGALWRRGRKKSGSVLKTPEQMAAFRRRVWQLMAKKELSKVQRLKSNNHKEALINNKRMATVCLKIGRQRAMQSQRVMRETVWRAKRLTREMQGYWKRYDRTERETRRRMEKEAEEQRKHDVELNEAKRQQRKLNFLITQTELYAHFMSRKLGNGSEEEQLKILSQLDEERTAKAAMFADDYDW